MVRAVLLLVITLGCTAVTYAGAASSPSWRQFRGPHRNGISDETGLLKSWPAKGPKLLWTYDKCGVGYAGITISDGFLLTVGTFEEGAKITALGMDGKLRWSAINGTGRWRVPRNKKDWARGYGGSRSTPTIVGDRLYHLGVQGRLASYELRTGKEVWAIDLKTAFKGIRNEWGYSESVLIDKGRLYCLPGGPGGFMACLEAATGKTIWTCKEIPDKKASNASAALVEVSGVPQLVTMTTVLVIGVRAKDGKLLWHTRHANRFRENCEIPQYVDGILLVSSGYRHGSEGYRITRGDGDAWAIKQVWRTNHADNLHGGPIIRDGCVFAAGYDRKGAFCLDLKTGAFKWRHKPIGRSSYTFAEGLLYRLGENGTMALERPNPKKYDPVCSFRIPTARKSICLTHPVICGKRLYIRHQQNLYCYDIADPKSR